MIDGDTPDDHGPASSAWQPGLDSGAAAGQECGTEHRSGLHAGHDGVQPDPPCFLSDRRADSAIRLRAPGGAIRSALAVTARHPLCTWPGRLEPLAIPAHGPADDHGRVVVLGGDQRTGSTLLCLSAGARDGAVGTLRQSRRGALLYLF